MFPDSTVIIVFPLMLTFATSMPRPSFYTLLCCFFCFTVTEANAQKPVTDSTAKQVVLDDVVVTATRTEKSVGDVPIPVMVISKKQIQQMGTQRLAEVLQQQTGLVLADNPLGQALQGYPNPFGAGIQLQGLDPAYTLILVDGEPLTGRNAGVLNLDRIPVGSIRQIEVVKGPASSLYGSDALAGVINIITDEPKKPAAQLQLHHATNNTWGTTISKTFQLKNTGVRLFANRYSSNGYDLDETIYGKTVDPAVNYSFSARTVTALNPSTQLLLSARLFTQNQRNNYIVYNGTQPEVVTGKSKESDWGFNNQLQHRVNDKLRLTARLYATGYQNNAAVFLQKNNALFEKTFLRQFLLKPEIQAVLGNKNNQALITGIGYNYETINSSRYNERKQLNALYAFAQKEWWLRNRFNITIGARTDKHTLFSWQFNPKLAMAFRATPKLMFTASAGRGFKAPDFRQQFLLFNNSLVGYTLLGAAELSNGLLQLQQQGQLDPSANIAAYSNIQPLRPEYSLGLNAGARFSPGTRFTGAVNIFRNDISNLIERYNLPFTKINGQSIFSYININEVYTQGFDINLQYKAGNAWLLSGGYQYLEAKDKAIVEKIKKGEMFKRDPVTFVSSVVQMQDYGGLFNRSKHTANLQLAWTDSKSNSGMSLRAVYRGRFGFSDVNGNAILDDDQEYVDGYLMLNASIKKAFKQGFELQAGADNLLGHTDPDKLPSLAGRLFFINCNIDLQKIFYNHTKSTDK